MHRILAAVDLSDSTQSVLKFATEMARIENAAVSVVHAIPATSRVNALASSWGIGTAFATVDEPAELKSSLGQLQQVARAHGLAASDCHCVRAAAADAIRDTAMQLHADLIVTGSHGHGSLFHMMIGSVRETLLSHAPCPVCVVPNHDKMS